MRNQLQQLIATLSMRLTTRVLGISGVATALLLFTSGIAWGQGANHASTANSTKPARVPVIYDTDFAGDFDDTMGLVMVLKSPQFDLKLCTTTGGWRELHGKLLAKYLTAAGRTDVPIGIGGGDNVRNLGAFAQWLKDYHLSEYPGKVYQDGAQAMVDAINASPEPVTILANGPMNTLHAALKKDPGIAAKANLVAVFGNFNARDKQGKLYGNMNQTYDLPGTRLVFSAPWKSIAIAPKDTTILFLGKRYRSYHLFETKDPLLGFHWQAQERFIKFNHPTIGSDFAPDGSPIFKPNGAPPFEQCQFATESVYLAAPQHPFLNVEVRKVKVTDDGRTVFSPDGRDMAVGISWKNKDAFLDHVAEVLLSDTVRQERALRVGQVAVTADIFVATNGNDAWSGTLDSSNPGRTDGPVATFDRARQLIAAKLPSPKGQNRSWMVMFREGTYVLGNTVVFTKADTADAGQTVTYCAYPGEHPVISGGRRLTGWTVDPVTRYWRLTIPEVAAGTWCFGEMWVNGQRARWPIRPVPGGDWFHVARQVTSSGSAAGDTLTPPFWGTQMERLANSAKTPAGNTDRFGFQAGELSGVWKNPADICPARRNSQLGNEIKKWSNCLSNSG